MSLVHLAGIVILVVGAIGGSLYIEHKSKPAKSDEPEL